MKKRRNLNEIETVPRANPVAKHAYQFNKAHVIEDKKQYRRKAKHSKQEAFVNIGIYVYECLLIFQGIMLVDSFSQAPAWECSAGSSSFPFRQAGAWRNGFPT